MSSVVLIIYTQNIFDVLGYGWTFIIIGALSVLSKELKLELIKNFKSYRVVQKHLCKVRKYSARAQDGPQEVERN